jgi:hypothetical protein
MTLAPSGCAVFGAAAPTDVVAGFFTAYNGAPLAGGASATHAVVEDRRCALLAGASPTVCVYHPLGPDTPITVALPSWLQPGSVTASAVTVAGVVLGTVPVQAVSVAGLGPAVSFQWAQSVGGGVVAAYVLH